MAGVDDLYDLSVEYLGACEEAVATAPGGPIARSFVSPGLPALDCLPQLAVYVGGPVEAETRLTGPQLAAGRRPDDTGAVHLIALTCVVARCVPVIREGSNAFPTPAQMNAASQEVIADVWAIWNWVRAAYREGLIFTRPDGERRELYFDPAVPLGISGGAGGWMVPIRTALDGYAPVVGT